MNNLRLKDAAALRSRIALEPIAGPGSTVFPPTYPRDANSKERIYLLQTHEMLFDAHWHAFRVFGGVPRRGIYDSVH